MNVHFAPEIQEALRKFDKNINMKNCINKLFALFS